MFHFVTKFFTFSWERSGENGSIIVGSGMGRPTTRKKVHSPLKKGGAGCAHHDKANLVCISHFPGEKFGGWSCQGMTFISGDVMDIPCF